MKKPVIYLDTSVFGGCFDIEFSVWSELLIKDLDSNRFRPATSEIVALELMHAPRQVQQKYKQFLTTYDPDFLVADEDANTMVDAYLGHKILSEKHRNDLIHVAISTVNYIDVIASWNFKHIVHFEKISKFNAVNLEYGYHPLSIHSPRELVSYEKL